MCYQIRGLINYLIFTDSYALEDERGVMPEVEFVFDLELAPDFKPVNADGEVESFMLVPINKVR